MMQNYGGYGPPMRQEAPIFAAGGVQVTTARFVCWQQTYPIGGITSVAPFTVFAQKGSAHFATLWSGGWAVVWIISLCIGGGAGAFWLLLISLVCTAGAVAWARSLKDSYGVMITTAGMNVRAVISPDPAFTQAIVGALNHALSMR